MTTEFEHLHGVGLTLGTIGLIGLAGLVGRRGSINSKQRLVEFGEFGDDFGALIVYADDGSVDRFYVVDGRDVSYFRHRPHMTPDEDMPWSMRSTKVSKKPSSVKDGIETALSALTEIDPEWVDWTDIPAAEMVFA